jgi:DNA polymerase (family X)
MELDKDGLRRGGKLIVAASEEDIYEALAIPFIEPELREGRGEIDLAIKHKLPKLVKDDDLRGLLHAIPIFLTGSTP